MWIAWLELGWCSEFLKSLLVIWLFLDVVKNDSFSFSVVLDKLGYLWVGVSFLRDSVGVEVLLVFCVRIGMDWIGFMKDHECLCICRYIGVDYWYVTPLVVHVVVCVLSLWVVNLLNHIISFC